MSKDDTSSIPYRGSLYDFNRGVKYIDTQRSALEALDDPRAINQSGYAHSIIDGYARSKLKKGKRLEDVDNKLHELGRVLISNKLRPFVEEIQTTRDNLNKVPKYEENASGDGDGGSVAPPYDIQGGGGGGNAAVGREKGV